MKRRGLVVAVVLAAGVGAALWWRSRPHAVEVSVATAENGPVEATVANTRAGTVEARRRAKLAPTTSGQVVKLPVDVGTRVNPGDLLLELRNDDLRAELKGAESRVRSAEARAQQACAQAGAARREAERAERLGARGVAPAAEVDQSTAEARASTKGCDAARVEIQAARDQVQVVRAALDRTRLTAPFGGVVAAVNAELGEIVSPSPPGIPTPPAIDLIDDAVLHVAAPIDEVDAPRVRLGMPVRVTVDALPGRTFAGTVTRIAPFVLDVEKQARTVEIEVALKDAEARTLLLPGYTADAEVILDARPETLRVPTEAVLEGGRVLVLRPDGVIEARDVKTGLSNWEKTEILSGLAAGERVVLSTNRPGVAPGAQAVAP